MFHENHINAEYAGIMRGGKSHESWKEAHRLGMQASRPFSFLSKLALDTAWPLRGSVLSVVKGCHNNSSPVSLTGLCEAPKGRCLKS